MPKNRMLRRGETVKCGPFIKSAGGGQGDEERFTLSDWSLEYMIRDTRLSRIIFIIDKLADPQDDYHFNLKHLIKRYNKKYHDLSGKKIRRAVLLLAHKHYLYVDNPLSPSEFYLVKDRFDSEKEYYLDRVLREKPPMIDTSLML